MTLEITTGTPVELEIGGTTTAELETTITGGFDKTYTQAFTSSSTIIVPHNLGKYPSTQIFDSAGDQVEGDVRHNSLNQLTVTFSASFTGTIICN